MKLFDRKGTCLKWQERLQLALPLRLMALLICLVCFGSSFYTRVRAGSDERKLSEIAVFTDITLSYGTYGGSGEAVEDEALLAAGEKLCLKYAYEIAESAYQANNIEAGLRYYLEISTHLEVPDLKRAEKLTLTMENETGTKNEKVFGYLHADGTKAWIEFAAAENGTGTVLSELYDEGISLTEAYFYLNCKRAGDPPAGEAVINGRNNRYVMKFEQESLSLIFGYKEYEPVEKEAMLQKEGQLTNNTIEWEIAYTPWQNPAEKADKKGIAQDSVFELRDEIDTSKHMLQKDSLEIEGDPVEVKDARPTVEEELYAFLEEDVDSGTAVLIIGGTKLNAVEASEANPAETLTITYKTTILDTLLLPSGGSGKSRSGGSVSISNTVELFIENDTSLGIRDSASVKADKPKWLEKKGKTVRDTAGNGSTTSWTIEFFANGYSFADDADLTLYDKLPSGSSLSAGTLKVMVGNNDISSNTVLTETDDGFTVSGITTENKKVVVTYQTTVPEEMYDNGTDLGSNTAWFAFHYDGNDYATEQVQTAVGNGAGSTSSSTAILSKENSGYNPKTRSIEWTVTINPHKANFNAGTFTDNLNAGVVGGACSKGHTGGLELVGEVRADIIDISGQRVPNNGLVTIQYIDNIITAHVGNIGRSTVTLTFTTKVCDPCLFAGQTQYAGFTNWIAGSGIRVNGSERNDFSAQSTVIFSVEVLKKKAPVYDYATGIMTWTVEVNDAGLPMEEIILTDVLPVGLTYVEGSLASDVTAGVNVTADQTGQQTLTVSLGELSQKTAVTFQTKVDPEKLGLADNAGVNVQNTVSMAGKADGVDFETAHTVSQKLVNHGLLKRDKVDAPQELIEYEVLINPYGVALPENPVLVDVMDSKLQLDWDTLRLYKAELSGTAGDGTKKPEYTKVMSSEQTLQVKAYDAETNSFMVELPISADDREAYVLTYTADMTRYENGGSYTNSISFQGDTYLLGGKESNYASVGGGGGGGGGGVAARKASIIISKKDRDSLQPLKGVQFTLYQWDDTNGRGMAFAQAASDEMGRLTFRVKPGAKYELVESSSMPGYDAELGWSALPEGVAETADGLLITAGAKGSALELELTNKAITAELSFKVVNQEGIPLAGRNVSIYPADPQLNPSITPLFYTNVALDGTVSFQNLNSGLYYVVIPGGGTLKITIPDVLGGAGAVPTVEDADGNPVALDGYQAVGTVASDEEWTLTIEKVADDGTTRLAGAVFALYADAACQTLLKEETSDADGKLAFSGLQREQTYYLRETAAPTGYQQKDTIYTVDKNNAALTIENTRISQIGSGSGGSSSGGSSSGSGNRPGSSSGNRPGSSSGNRPGSGSGNKPGSGLNSSLGSGQGNAGGSLPEGSVSGTEESIVESGSADIINPDRPHSGSGEHAEESVVSERPNKTEDDSKTEALGMLGGADKADTLRADIPQTGDSTGWLGMLTLASGLLLLGLTVYGRCRRKQLGKE